MLVGATIVLTVVNWQLALTAAVAMPPIAVLAYFFAHRVFPISREVQRKKGHLTEASDEAVVGIEMVQAFGREDDVRDRFHDRAEAVRHETMRQASVEARFLPGLVFLPTLGIAAVLFVGGREAIAGNLTIGQFTLFITLLLQLVWPLEALGWIINLGQRATAAASRSFAWLDGIESLPEAEHPAAVPDGPLPVRFEGVRFAYPTGGEVLPGSTSTRPPARSSRSAGRQGRARRRCSTCCRGSTTRPRGASCSAASTRATSRSRRSARRSRSSRRRRCCSRCRSATISSPPGRTPTGLTSSMPARRPVSPSSWTTCRTATTR